MLLLPINPSVDPVLSNGRQMRTRVKGEDGKRDGEWESKREKEWYE
jgi:hypothetical protein